MGDPELGIGGPNIVNGAGGANAGGTACADPTPNAILRIQRLKDNNWSSCTYAAAAGTPSTDYWPNVLFDTREGLQRDCGPGGTSNCTGAGNVALGGVMYYIAIDAANLSQWFKKTAPFNAGTGNLSKTDNTGYTVYSSPTAGTTETRAAWKRAITDGKTSSILRRPPAHRMPRSRLART